MFKAARWRSEKNKTKAVFRLQFQATHVPSEGWESMTVTLIPTETGRPTTRSERAPAIDGECHWTSPIYESVKLAEDPRTGKINDKVYQFLVSSTGSTKSGFLGETTINLAEYAEALKPSSVSLPLKGSNSGAILHLTVQRMQGDVEGRVADENGDVKNKKQRRTLESQLSISADLEGSKAQNSTNGINPTEVREKFPSCRNMALNSHSNVSLAKSNSFDAISASGSDTSSGQYTPKESILLKEPASLLSPLGGRGTLREGTSSSTDSSTDLGDWSAGLAPDGSTGGSMSSSAEAGLSETPQESDDVAMKRRLELSELELQTLRKQVVKENRRVQDLSKELSGLREERDSLARECEDLKSSNKQKVDDEDMPRKLQQLEGEDPWSTLEEIKKELKHEKTLSLNLRLQLQKTQESNSELILAVRDLDEMLEQRNKEEEVEEIELENGFPHQQDTDPKQELSETNSENEEQYALDLLVSAHDCTKPTSSLEQKINDLNGLVEFYKKDREEIEMQMEQLALDYEILKQENHDTSLKLEQAQLREQLRMQYECLGHLSIISDLENYAETLEKELQKQSEAFEADLVSVTDAKVIQEKRAIQSEEALRKTRVKNARTVERLQEELKRLSVQLVSAFHVNKKVVMEAVAESSELGIQKSRLEELLEKANEELALVKGQYKVKFQQLLCLLDFKTKEGDKLLSELKAKSKELENQRKSEEKRGRALSEEMAILKAEIEGLLRENERLSEQMEYNEKLETEMEHMKTLAKERELLFEKRNIEGNELERKLTLTREEVDRTRKELNEKDVMVINLNSEVARLVRHYSEQENLRSVVNLEEKLKDHNEDAVEGMRNNDNKSDLLSRGNKDDSGLHEKIELLEAEIKWKDATLVELRDLFLQEKVHRNLIVEIERSMKSFSRNKPGLCDQIVYKDNLLEGQHEDKTEEQKGISLNLQQLSGANLQEECGVDKNITSVSTTNENNNINIGANTENKEDASLLCGCDRHNMCEILSELSSLKERNYLMESELKEMQERYSEMSLKFAEVEGERQQLVINVRNLKNALKN